MDCQPEDEDQPPLIPYPLAALSSPLKIRPYGAADWPAVWSLLEPVFRAGETFPHDPAITEGEARALWVDQSLVVMVAIDAGGCLVGTYYLRPNSLALGAHVANAGYVVAGQARRQGIGSRLCRHSLQAARGLGFRSMQFNLVVSTNTAGLRCWQRNGFRIVGTLPGAFRHRQLGYVDALVMVRSLADEGVPLRLSPGSTCLQSAIAAIAAIDAALATATDPSRDGVPALIRIGAMELHVDLSERAVLDTNILAWQPSPMAGVDRRMLDRCGGEVARATSIVRYAPGSRFERHSHGGGEEILVLEGTFSDEQGDYPAGTYLRNPVGSCHAPFSEEGCTLLVKLQQMHPADQQRLVIDTLSASWLPGLVKGLEVMPLHTYGSEQVALVRWAPGTMFQPHGHPGGEEILVLEGVFQDEHGTYPAGSWLRNPPGSTHRPWSEAGCTIWVKTGHLPSSLGPDGSDA